MSVGILYGNFKWGIIKINNMVPVSPSVLKGGKLASLLSYPRGNGYHEE